MLREITLPSNIPARLFRSPMPGRWDWDIKRAERDINEHEVDLVVSLSPMREVREFAPRYARLIEDENLTWELWDFPIQSGGIPEDEEEFLDLARDIAEELRSGTHVLIHCREGTGRTGMLAILSLVALGMRLGEARRAVEEAGAWPENARQDQFIERMARLLAQDEEI